MANITRRMAFYDLRDWWLSFSRVEDLLNASERNRFFPAAQQPGGGFPYVRYNIRKTNAYPQWWMATEYIVLEAYFEDIEDSTELVNILASLTGRGDTSARELQQWVSTATVIDSNGGVVPRPNDFSYHWLEFAGGSEISPPDEEGATHGRNMSFVINYSHREGYGIA
ncbi:MAG: hypothetical protein LC650_00945 [Actinobacteria bacterium]|nr:hypothetical protein [Actinomycetota bacterium]